MNSLTRRSASARSSRGTVTRTEVSPNRLANSSTSNGFSSEMSGIGAPVAADGREDGAVGDFEAVMVAVGGPRTESEGSLGGYLSNTGDASRPTNRPGVNRFPGFRGA